MKHHLAAIVAALVALLGVATTVAPAQAVTVTQLYDTGSVFVPRDGDRDPGRLVIYLHANRFESGDVEVEALCISHSEAGYIEGKTTALYADGIRVWARHGRNLQDGSSNRCFPSIAGHLIDADRLVAVHTFHSTGKPVVKVDVQ